VAHRQLRGVTASDGRHSTLPEVISSTYPFGSYLSGETGLPTSVRRPVVSGAEGAVVARKLGWISGVGDRYIRRWVDRRRPGRAAFPGDGLAALVEGFGRPGGSIGKIGSL